MIYSFGPKSQETKTEKRQNLVAKKMKIYVTWKNANFMIF